MKWLLALVAALWLFFPRTCRAAAPVELEAAVGRRVDRVEIVNHSRVPDAEIRMLFLVKPGDPYDLEAVRRSLGLLSAKQAIRNVVVRGSRVDGEGLALTVEVTSEPLIQTVRFYGESALAEKDLRGRIRTQVDQPVRREYLEADAKALHELYAEAGYPEATITTRAEAVAGGYWIDVAYDIREGKPLRVTRLDLGQVPEEERERATALLGLKIGSIASERALRKGVQKLLEVFRREGYVEARAPKARLEREPSGAAVLVPLVLGSVVDLRFEGIEEGETRPLFDVAAARFGEPVDDIWAEQVAAPMADALRAEGYVKAVIAPDLGEREGRRRVTFRVHTGPQVRASLVTFEGNATQPTRRLRSYMSVLEGGLVRAPPFTQEALDRDLKVLSDYYVARGFWDARVTLADLQVPDSGKAVVRVRIEEGQRYRLGKVVFEGALPSEEAGAVAEIRTGDWADPGELEAARVRLLAALNKRGYSDAKVDYQAAKRPEAGVVDATYRVQTGTLVRFGRVVVSGNARTHAGVILRELTFSEGEPWNAAEVLVSRQKLLRLGYFQKVRIEPFGGVDHEGQRDVRVAVEEQDAGSVTFGAGYGSEEGIKGFAEMAHTNLFGYGREVRVRGDVEGRDWSYSLNFREPWLLGYQNDLALTLFRQFQHQEAYDLYATAFRSTLERRLTGHLRGSVVYTLSYNDLRNVTPDADVQNIDRYLLSAVGPVIVWDSRDDPFNPREGHQHTFQAEWARKELGSEVQYGRYVGSLSGYYSVSRVTLALLARGGLAVEVLGTQTLPVNKRFFLGGRTSVRGFERDEIGPKAPDGTPSGGDTMINLRAELRFPLWKQLGADLFWDAGNVWNRKVDNPDYLSLRQGAGGGLRYNTPVGPVAVDIGYKLDRKSGESASVWNFTIGNVF